MTFVDEWAHEKWNSFGMLNAEAILAFIGMIVFITIFVSVNRTKEEVIFETD